MISGESNLQLAISTMISGESNLQLAISMMISGESNLQLAIFAMISGEGNLQPAISTMIRSVRLFPACYTRRIVILSVVRHERSRRIYDVMAPANLRIDFDVWILRLRSCLTTLRMTNEGLFTRKKESHTASR